jgi:mono/diheme cytochrome c family protein
MPTTNAAPVTAPATAAAAPSADLESGKRVFEQTCVICHGEDGRGGHGGGAPLDQARDPAAIAEVVSFGRNAMPGLATLLTSEQIRDVAAYVAERLAEPEAATR